MLFVKLLVVLRYQQSVCVVLKIHVLNINVAAVVSLQESFLQDSGKSVGYLYDFF